MSKGHSPNVNSGRDSTWSPPRRACTEAHPDVDQTQQKQCLKQSVFTSTQQAMPREGLLTQTMFHLPITSRKGPETFPFPTSHFILWHFARTTKHVSTRFRDSFPTEHYSCWMKCVNIFCGSRKQNQDLCLLTTSSAVMCLVLHVWFLLLWTSTLLPAQQSSFHGRDKSASPLIPE